MIYDWKPPFYLYWAGCGSAKDRRYSNDVMKTPPPRRLLVKYTLSGQGVLYVKDKRHELNCGDLFVIERPGPYLYCYEGNGEPWKFIFFSIGFSSPPGVLPVALQENPVFPIGEQPKLKSMIEELVKIRMEPGDRTSMLGSSLAYRFLLTYIKIRTEEQISISPAAEKLRLYLTENFAERLDLGELSHDLRYSQEALIRLFTAAFGLSPGKYLQRLRLRCALELLQNSSLSIKEIAEECGYYSQNYFCRMFRQSFGITASGYRANPNPLLYESLEN
jgi:AraC-like DNA-binding protein